MYPLHAFHVQPPFTPLASPNLTLSLPEYPPLCTSGYISLLSMPCFAGVSTFFAFFLFSPTPIRSYFYFASVPSGPISRHTATIPRDYTHTRGRPRPCFEWDLESALVHARNRSSDLAIPTCLGWYSAACSDEFMGFWNMLRHMDMTALDEAAFWSLSLPWLKFQLFQALFLFFVSCFRSLVLCPHTNTHALTYPRTHTDIVLVLSPLCYCSTSDPSSLSLYS